MLFSLTNLIEAIFPSIPLLPNPGATITPLVFFSLVLILDELTLSDNTHFISTLEFKLAPA